MSAEPYDDNEEDYPDDGQSGETGAGGEGSTNGKADTPIYIGNLPIPMSEALREQFSNQMVEYGVRSLDYKAGYAFGFLNGDRSFDGLNQVLDTGNFLDRKLRLSYASGSGSAKRRQLARGDAVNVPNTRLFVTKFDFQTTEAELRAVIAKYGNPTSVSRNENHSYAFIEFATPEEARVVRDGIMNGKEAIRGNPLVVEFSTGSRVGRGKRERGSDYRGGSRDYDGHSDRGSYRRRLSPSRPPSRDYASRGRYPESYEDNNRYPQRADYYGYPRENERRDAYYEEGRGRDYDPRSVPYDDRVPFDYRDRSYRPVTPPVYPQTRGYAEFDRRGAAPYDNFGADRQVRPREYARPADYPPRDNRPYPPRPAYGH